MKKYGFKRGWNKANSAQKKSLMKGLMKIYEITTVQAVYARIRGDVEPRVSQADATERLFEKHNITDIWDKRKVKIRVTK